MDFLDQTTAVRSRGQHVPLLFQEAAQETTRYRVLLCVSETHRNLDAVDTGSGVHNLRAALAGEWSSTSAPSEIVPARRLTEDLVDEGAVSVEVLRSELKFGQPSMDVIVDLTPKRCIRRSVSTSRYWSETKRTHSTSDRSKEGPRAERNTSVCTTVRTSSDSDPNRSIRGCQTSERSFGTRCGTETAPIQGRYYLSNPRARSISPDPCWVSTPSHFSNSSVDVT